LAISVLNGGSNKTAESVTFTTATASSTSNHGKFTFNVDGTDIFDIDDSGINLASGKTFRINGTAIDGDITSVVAGTGLSGGGTDGDVTLNVEASQAITALTGGDLTIFEDANNADVSLKLGTSATESLTIEVLNGSSNKTAEEVHFSTATASGTANHGKMVFDIDGTDQLEINDSGVTVTGDLTITGDDLFMNTNTAGHILVGDDTNYNPVAVSGDIGLASNGAMTIQAGAVEHGMLADDIISGQDEITSGFAAADELMYSDAGTIKRVGLDTLATKLFSVASAGTVAQASDHMLFLDGGATGDVIVESIDDFLSAIAGSGISVSSSQLTAASGAVTALNNATANELVTVGSTTTELDSETNLTFDGTDLKLLKDANNADVSVVLGTADAESLTIQVNNGSSNKAAESVTFATATAESGSNAGKMIFNVDGADILTIDDGGIDFESGKTISVGGTDVIFGDGLNSLTAGAIANGDSIVFIDANDSNATKKEAVADLATLFAGTGLTASSSVIGVDASQAITALTGGDLTLFEDANNADVSFKMGTSATEALSIEVLNGGSNKTNEEVKIMTTTASGTGNHGKISVHIDEVEILDIDDGGIDLASGMTFAVDGTDVVSANSLNSLTAGTIADGDSLVFIDADDSNASKKEAVADLATLFAGDGLAASSSVLGIDLATNSGLEISSNKLQIAKGISQHDVAQFTSGVVDNDFLRVDGTVVEGRSASEVLSDIGAQASLTFGISNTNAVKIDAADVADDEYARFTANGLESRTAAEVAADIGPSVADLHGAGVDGSNNQLLTDDGDGTVTSESNLTFDGSTLTVTGDVTLADDKTITLADEGQVIFGDTAPSADHKATGVVVKMTATDGVGLMEAVYINGSGKLDEADADAVGTMPAIGVALEANASGSDAVIKVLIQGVLRDDTFDFTPGADLFIGTSDNAGLITETAPSGSGDTVQKVGVALTADTAFLNFNTAEVLLA
jgi:hypothetical protein